MMQRMHNSLLWTLLKFSSPVLFVAAIFMMVLLRSSITSLEYRISDLEGKKLRLANTHKELLVERSELLSVKNLETYAMRRLGLAFPDRKKVVYVRRDEEPYNVKTGYHLPSE